MVDAADLKSAGVILVGSSPSPGTNLLSKEINPENNDLSTTRWNLCGSELLLLELKNIGKIFHRWGGAPATFFTYTHFTHDLLVSVLIPVLPLIRASLGLSYLQAGLLVSAYTITTGFSQIPMGWLGDRTSRRVVVAIGLTGVSVAAIAIGLSPAYYPMLALLIIQGVFAGAYHPSATSMLSGHFDSVQRGKVLGFHLLGGSIGFATAPILGGIIGDMLGWRYAFIILSIPALISVPLVLKKFRLSQSIDNSQLTEETLSNAPIKAVPKLASLAKVLKPIAAITALAVLTQLIIGSMIAFIPLYLVDKHGLLAAYAAILISVIRGGGMIGTLLGGWLSDKWGRKKVILLAVSAVGPVVYLLTILPFNAALIVIFILFGMFMMMRQPAVQTMIMDAVSPRLRATAIGIYLFLSMEGVSMAQPVVGYFMDIWGIVQVFHVIGLISIGLSVMAILWAVRMRLT